MSLTSRAVAAFNTLLGVRVEPAKEPTRNRHSMADGLVNAMSGMGTGLDKATGNEWDIPTTQTKAALEFQFRSSWYANQIVRIPAQDMTREWVTHKGGDPDFIKDMRNAERKLNVRHHITSAIKWSRLYGGGGLILGTGDPSDLNDLVNPFDVADTKEDQLRYLRFVDRWRLSGTGDLDRDPQSGNFDNPAFYLMAGGEMGGFRIHHSRVIRFGGNELPWQLWTQNARWDDSVLQNTQEAIQQLTAATQAICSMLYDANFDVIGVPNLFEAIGAGQEDAIKRRFQLASSVKSWLRAIIIDKDETYETKQRSFSQIADILERLQINLCGAADVPYTRMFGQSPAGMNATGASDLEMYYSMIKSEQETTLRPKLSVLFECIARSACGGFPDDYDFEFNPLKIESASTLATIQSSNANRDNIYMQAGVITAAQCAENLRADGTYSCISDEDIELIKEMEKAADAQSEATAYPPEKEGFTSQNTKAPPDGSADPEKVRAADSTDAKFWRRKGFTRAQADALAFTAKNLRDGYQSAVIEWVEAVENGEAEEYEATADLRRRFGNAAVVAFNEVLNDGFDPDQPRDERGMFSSEGGGEGNSALLGASKRAEAAAGRLDRASDKHGEHSLQAQRAKKDYDSAVTTHAAAFARHVASNPAAATSTDPIDSPYADKVAEGRKRLATARRRLASTLDKKQTAERVFARKLASKGADHPDTKRAADKLTEMQRAHETAGSKLREAYSRHGTMLANINARTGGSYARVVGVDGHLEQVRHAKTGQFSSDPQVGLTAAEKEHLKAHADGGNALAQLAIAMHGQGLHNEARVICGALKDVEVADFDPDQPRDERGMWSGGEGGGGYGALSSHEKASLVAHAHAGHVGASIALERASKGMHHEARALHQKLGAHASLQPKQSGPAPVDKLHALASENMHATRAQVEAEQRVTAAIMANERDPRHGPSDAHIDSLDEQRRQATERANRTREALDKHVSEHFGGDRRAALAANPHADKDVATYYENPAQAIAKMETATRAEANAQYATKTAKTAPIAPVSNAATIGQVAAPMAPKPTAEQHAASKANLDRAKSQYEKGVAAYGERPSGKKDREFVEHWRGKLASAEKSHAAIEAAMKDGEAFATPKAVDDGAADQPREPAGTPEGGQFAGGEGAVGGLTPGVHVGKFVTGKGNAGIEKAVQSAVLKAGLHKALAAHPISKVAIVKQTQAWKDGELKDSNSSGVYHRDAREVQIKETRKEGSWGHEFKPGETHSMSMAAPTHDEAVARTFLHETAHHLFHQDEKLKAAAQKAFDSHPKETKMVNGKPKEQFAGKRGFSKYAEKSASEYVAEALVAYVYHPKELKAHDPKAFALAKKMVTTRGLKVKQ